MACSPSNVPDRSSWVNIRSSRYVVLAHVLPEEDGAAGVDGLRRPAQRRPAATGSPRRAAPRPCRRARIVASANAMRRRRLARRARASQSSGAPRRPCRPRPSGRRTSTRPACAREEREERGQVRSAQMDLGPRARSRPASSRAGCATRRSRRARRRSRRPPGSRSELAVSLRALLVGARQEPARAPRLDAADDAVPAPLERGDAGVEPRRIHGTRDRRDADRRARPERRRRGQSSAGSSPVANSGCRREASADKEPRAGL